MSTDEQGLKAGRYQVIPRTAIFVRRRDSYLLLKGAPTKRLWANQYNGLGGHIERGEDVLAAARRELLEETGLNVDLWLCGTLMVETGDPQVGIGLFIFCGECLAGEPQPSPEGQAEWIPYEMVRDLPVVEDLPVLLERLHAQKRGDLPFSARSYRDEADKVVVVFAE